MFSRGLDLLDGDRLRDKDLRSEVEAEREGDADWTAAL